MGDKRNGFTTTPDDQRQRTSAGWPSAKWKKRTGVVGSRLNEEATQLLRYSQVSKEKLIMQEVVAVFYHVNCPTGTFFSFFFPCRKSKSLSLREVPVGLTEPREYARGTYSLSAHKTCKCLPENMEAQEMILNESSKRSIHSMNGLRKCINGYIYLYFGTYSHSDEFMAAQKEHQHVCVMWRVTPNIRSWLMYFSFLFCFFCFLLQEALCMK